MNRRTVFQVAVLLQLVVLGWMVAAKERSLASGARVVLSVAPGDPIDHLAGRYVSISPAIARIDTGKVRLDRGDAGDGPTPAAANAPLTGRVVFVELVQEGEVWIASRVIVEGAGAPPRVPFLRAGVTEEAGPILQLDYSLDRFFIPADGRDPSFLVFEGKHTVRIVVRAPDDGVGVIEDLLVDGKAWKEWDAAERASGR
jgi:hypothetical protein